MCLSRVCQTARLIKRDIKKLANKDKYFTCRPGCVVVDHFGSAAGECVRCLFTENVSNSTAWVDLQYAATLPNTETDLQVFATCNNMFTV